MVFYINEFFYFRFRGVVLIVGLDFKIIIGGWEWEGGEDNRVRGKEWFVLFRSVKMVLGIRDGSGGDSE